MADQGKGSDEVIGSGVILAIDDTFDLAVDTTYALSVEHGIDLSGKSASQTV